MLVTILSLRMIRGDEAEAELQAYSVGIATSNAL
jgi:hypothetical protein